MSWATYHAQSEELASQAEAALRNGDRDRALAACRRDNTMANYKALRLVRSRPFVPEKPQERIRENPGA